MVDFLKAGMSLMFESTNENYDFRGFGVHQCRTNEKSYTKYRKTLYI